MIVYTSICMNYMPKALILGKSLKKYNKNIKFYVIMVEREIPKEVTTEMYDIIDKIILAKDLGYEDFDKFIFKHSIVEASTSVKGQALLYLLEHEKEDKVVYIDPDIKIYNKFTKLDKLLDSNDIILTPHVTSPEGNERDIINNELGSLKYGAYNLGFLAVSNTDEGLRFAKWWRDRLNLYCYDDIPNGIFTDQKWVDLAPGMFNVYILKDEGYNMAPWNLSTRKLYKDEDGELCVNNKYKLVFFHFSGFDSGANLERFEYYVKNKEALEFQIRNEYIEDLKEAKHGELGNYKWSYSCFNSGEKILNEVRQVYRKRKFFLWVEKNPFEYSNKFFNDLFGINIKHKISISTLGRKIKAGLIKIKILFYK